VAEIEGSADGRAAGVATRFAAMGAVRDYELDLWRSAGAHHGRRGPGSSGVCVAGTGISRGPRQCAAIPQPRTGPRSECSRCATTRGTGDPEGPRLAGKGLARPEPIPG